MWEISAPPWRTKFVLRALQDFGTSVLLERWWLELIAEEGKIQPKASTQNAPLVIAIDRRGLYFCDAI